MYVTFHVHSSYLIYVIFVLFGGLRSCCLHFFVLFGLEYQLAIFWAPLLCDILVLGEQAILGLAQYVPFVVLSKLQIFDVVDSRKVVSIVG